MLSQSEYQSKHWKTNYILLSVWDFSSVSILLNIFRIFKKLLTLWTVTQRLKPSFFEYKCYSVIEQETQEGYCSDTNFPDSSF